MAPGAFGAWFGPLVLASGLVVGAWLVELSVLVDELSVEDGWDVVSVQVGLAPFWKTNCPFR